MEVGQDVLIVESHYVVGWTGVFSCVCMGCVNLCCIHQLGWCVYSPRFSGGLVSNYVVDTHHPAGKAASQLERFGLYEVPFIPIA